MSTITWFRVNEGLPACSCLVMVKVQDEGMTSWQWAIFHPGPLIQHFELHGGRTGKVYEWAYPPSIAR